MNTIISKEMNPQKCTGLTPAFIYLIYHLGQAGGCSVFDLDITLPLSKTQSPGMKEHSLCKDSWHRVNTEVRGGRKYLQNSKVWVITFYDFPVVSQRGNLIPSPILVSFAVQSNVLGYPIAWDIGTLEKESLFCLLYPAIPVLGL